MTEFIERMSGAPVPVPTTVDGPGCTPAPVRPVLLTEGEIRARAVIESALYDLSDEARARVLRWAAERYGIPAHPEGDA